MLGIIVQALRVPLHTEEEAVVGHRSSIGAIERVIGFLIEHYAGAFPVWLAPVQTVIIPISQDQAVAAQQVV